MKKVRKQRFEYIANEFGIAIKKSCMSCAHKQFTRSLSKRYCTEHEAEVKPTQVCSLWKMSNQMKMAGSGLGKVRDIVTKEVIIQ
jgi:hypothetical protein